MQRRTVTARPRPPRASRFHLWLTASVIAAVLAVAVISTLYGFRTTVATRHPVIVIVQNEVAIGSARLVESPAPAYLSSRPVPSCSTRGCEVSRSQVLSGTTLQVTCQIRGATMTNEDRASPGIARNKNGATSSRWYWCTLLNGAAGYLPEVYVAAAYRGGQGLPAC
jgi:hypothetical protein